MSTYRGEFVGAHDRCVGVHVWLIELVREREREKRRERYEADTRMSR